jgi:hypothetical protein
LRKRLSRLEVDSRWAKVVRERETRREWVRWCQEVRAEMTPKDALRARAARRLNSVGSFNREVLMSNDIKKWTPNQLKAIYWFATPKVERKPRFQKKFAETLGVRGETISRWQNDPELTQEINRVARAELGKDLPEVYGTLRKMAIKGSFQHMKLYLELLEEYRKEVDVNVTDKRRKLREALTELECKRKESAPHRELGCADEAS